VLQPLSSGTLVGSEVKITIGIGKGGSGRVRKKSVMKNAVADALVSGSHKTFQSVSVSQKRQFTGLASCTGKVIV
jgi:hypothetical protein